MSENALLEPSVKTVKVLKKKKKEYVPTQEELDAELYMTPEEKKALMEERDQIKEPVRLKALPKLNAAGKIPSVLDEIDSTEDKLISKGVVEKSAAAIKAIIPKSAQQTNTIKKIAGDQPEKYSKEFLDKYWKEVEGLSPASRASMLKYFKEEEEGGR